METIIFNEIPELTEEHKYENPGFIQTTPNYNRGNTLTPVPKAYKYIQDDVNRPPVIPPRLPECRPLPNPPASGNRSPVQKTFSHGAAVQPAYTNTFIRSREPYPNYPGKNLPDRYQQETVQTVPTFETKQQMYHEIDPIGIFGEGKTIIQESSPKFDDVDRFQVKEDRPPFPPPYRPDYYPPSDTNGHQMRAKRSQSVDFLGAKPEIPPRSVIDTTSFNSNRRLEPKPGDPEYLNCVGSHAHRPSRIPVSSDIDRSSGVVPVDTLMHRLSPMVPTDTQMHRVSPMIPTDTQMHRFTGIIPMDTQMYRPPPIGVIPVDTQMHRPIQVVQVDPLMHRPPPSQVVQVDPPMHRPPPIQVMQVDPPMHRPPPSQVVRVDPLMQRPNQALPVDTRSTGAIPTDMHRHSGDIGHINSDLHRPSAFVTSKYNTSPRIMKEYDGGLPMKTSDEYLVMFAQSVEDSKDTQQLAEGKRGEDSSMGVFNLKEMINEKTETVIDEQGMYMYICICI